MPTDYNTLDSTPPREPRHGASYCLVCGRDLQRKATGRPRRFCSNACRQRDYRELCRWAKRAVDAAQAGDPEPAQRWRWAVQFEAHCSGPFRPRFVTIPTDTGIPDVS